MKKTKHTRKDFLETARSLKSDELLSRIRDEQEKIFLERFKHHTQPGEKAMSFKKAKKDLARLLTIQHEKGRAEVKR